MEFQQIREKGRRKDLDCALFAGIAEEERAALLRCLGARRVPMRRGETLLRQGEAVREIGVVLSGAVQVRSADFFGNRTILAQLGPGELFGEAFACAGAEHAPVEAVCQQAGEALLLLGARLLTPCREPCAAHGQMLRNLALVLARKNLTLMRKTRILSRRTTREKLLSYFSERAREAGGGSFTLPFTRQELADYLCVDRSAMTVALMDLKREGWIELAGRSVRLCKKDE